MIMNLCRARDDDPGLQEAEAGFIRLLDKMTNGSKVRRRRMMMMMIRYY